MEAPKSLKNEPYEANYVRCIDILWHSFIGSIRQKKREINYQIKKVQFYIKNVFCRKFECIVWT